MAEVAASLREQEEKAAEQWAAANGLIYFDTTNFKDPPDVTSLVSTELLKTHTAAPLEFNEATGLVVGLAPETNLSQAATLASQITPTKVSFKAISASGYQQIFNYCYLRSFSAELEGDFKGFGDRLAEADPKEEFKLITQLAYMLEASDIHIEPGAAEARVRLRIDGILHPVAMVASDRYRLFLSDLQTKAKMKWGADFPQSGRISVELVNIEGNAQTVDMRLETIPVFHGEETIVRLFQHKTSHLSLEALGFSDQQRELVTTTVSRPDGMVLTVGPTGSGKTSTLYAVINTLNNPETKIVTLEDPVEYDLPDISQIPIHSEDKELFTEKLRAVLREDPNIIMIGEIRDADTARTAMQAALTGHVVLSTFHAASSSAAISRLMDMMGQNPLLPSAIRLIIAQRLVRRICTSCSESYTPEAKMVVRIKEVLASLPAEKRPKLEGLKLHRGKGCPVCHGLGYRGRIAIIEQLPISRQMEQLMTAVGTTEQVIETAALKEGMVSLLQDGLLKVLGGITTIEELTQVAEL